MKRTRVFWFAVLAIMVIGTDLALGAIPRSISYQGRLTDAVGTPVNDSVDLVFYICADSLCDRPLWMETHTSVIVANGLFTVRLGSITPIPTDAFDGSSRWLSATKDGVPASPTLRMLSSPYTFRSLYADTAYYAKYVSGTDCDQCVLMFVDAIGPDSVIATSGTAFAGKVFKNIAADIYGIRGYAANTGIGGAFGGLFIAADSGTGFHFGVRGEAWGSSSGLVEGVGGFGGNTGSGDAYGGRFSTLTNGTGIHYALFAEGYGASSSPVYGTYSTAANGSSGEVYGGHFWALSGGTGTRYGLYSKSNASSSSNSYGIYATASNSSSGRAYGGSFSALTGGTNFHIGVEAKSEAANTLTSYGVWGQATNTSSGETVGGYFRAMSPGTGDHYAIAGNAWSASAADAYGSVGWAENTSTGGAYGGYFLTDVSGSGIHSGAKVEGYGASSNVVHGINVRAENTSSGAIYGGLFTAASGGTGIHYGLYTQSQGGSSNHTYAAYGAATNTSTGDAYGGYFVGNQDGTGEHYGLVGLGYSNDDTRCFGVYGYAQNTSHGERYGGYFFVPNEGTGVQCGVYAEAPVVDYGYAGIFQGRVRVTGDLSVGGDKSAAVRMDNGDYRGLSCQESPEVWFEDFGEGQLSSGMAHIDLDPLFLQTVTINADHPMKVFVQLEGDCNGVYVEKGMTGFDVNELKGGGSDVSFSYRIVAKRRGYEDQRLPVMTGPTPDEMRARSAEIEAKMKAREQSTPPESLESRPAPVMLESE